jgi:hypothetical protein
MIMSVAVRSAAIRSAILRRTFRRFAYRHSHKSVCIYKGVYTQLSGKQRARGKKLDVFRVCEDVLCFRFCFRFSVLGIAVM